MFSIIKNVKVYKRLLFHVTVTFLIIENMVVKIIFKTEEFPRKYHIFAFILIPVIWKLTVN